MAHTQARPDFHTTVQLEMSRRGWGLRTLARTLAGDDATHEQVEVERRAVRRWLTKGANPSQANRRRVAAALGLPEQMFDDADDEEESLSAILHREVELATQRGLRLWEQKQRERGRESVRS